MLEVISFIVTVEVLVDSNYKIHVKLINDIHNQKVIQQLKYSLFTFWICCRRKNDILQLILQISSQFVESLQP